MKRNWYGGIGSVSTGTLCDVDLFDSFLWEAQHLRLTKDERKQVSRMKREENHDACKYLGNDAWDCGHIDQAAGECDCHACDRSMDVEELTDILNNHALPYFYFGAHPGDGADFGYWLSEDFENEFDGLKVSDTSEVPRGYTGEVLHVSDHGNMTLYSASRGRLHEIWAIV